MAGLSEFAIIERFFTDRSATLSAGELGIGDDCALLSIPAGFRLAVSIDTAVENRHFPAGGDPADVAYRCAAAAASDLAAMGARPLAATLALCLPAADESWLSPFSQGFKQAMQDFGLQLIGGDTTKGPLTITVQVHGLVPNGQSLLRSGAQLGDLVFVSGSLGDAAAALQVIAGEVELSDEHRDFVYRQFYRPQPRLALGQALLPLATSAIDISDGLVADLGHIASQSGVGAQLFVEQLPLSPALTCGFGKTIGHQLALTGGDDYELCFTVPAALEAQIQQLARECHLDLTCVGKIVSGHGVTCLDGQGEPVHFPRTGYQHF